VLIFQLSLVVYLIQASLQLLVTEVRRSVAVFWSPSWIPQVKYSILSLRKSHIINFIVWFSNFQ
jgi:hypothetical protein